MNLAVSLVEKMKANLHTILPAVQALYTMAIMCLASSTSSSAVLLPKYVEMSGNLTRSHRKPSRPRPKQIEGAAWLWAFHILAQLQRESCLLSGGNLG